jgi:hypothetical protein
MFRRDMLKGLMGFLAGTALPFKKLVAQPAADQTAMSVIPQVPLVETSATIDSEAEKQLWYEFFDEVCTPEWTLDAILSLSRKIQADRIYHDLCDREIYGRNARLEILRTLNQNLYYQVWDRIRKHWEVGVSGNVVKLDSEHLADLISELHGVALDLAARLVDLPQALQNELIFDFDIGVNDPVLHMLVVARLGKLSLERIAMASIQSSLDAQLSEVPQL